MFVLISTDMEEITASMIKQARGCYHQNLLDSILTISNSGIPSNADSSSKLSIRIAKGITDMLESRTDHKYGAQSSGKAFEEINMQFLQDTIPMLQEFRPAKWTIQRLGNSNKNGIANFEQYAHLEELNALASANKVLATAMGRDYMVCPDVVVYRDPLEDEELNKNLHLVDSETACRTILRKANGGKQILHASVSSKWTIRSDRSQNSRTEALNLIRNRKGHLPHIVVITAEPLPSRIASIALGTGDIDCVYHSFLYELVEAVNKANLEDASEMLNIMIDGKRLKDISDLPFDLMI